MCDSSNFNFSNKVRHIVSVKRSNTGVDVLPVLHRCVSTLVKKYLQPKRVQNNVSIHVFTAIQCLLSVSSPRQRDLVLPPAVSREQFSLQVFVKPSLCGCVQYLDLHLPVSVPDPDHADVSRGHEEARVLLPVHHHASTCRHRQQQQQMEAE